MTTIADIHNKQFIINVNNKGVTTIADKHNKHLIINVNNKGVSRARTRIWYIFVIVMMTQFLL